MRSKIARRSGILLHPSSLPGPWGIGDLGPQAHAFVDFLADTHQQLWQVLPLGPTGDDGSPYSSFSSSAGNPLLISIEAMAEDGLGRASQSPGLPDAAPVIHREVRARKMAALEQALGSLDGATSARAEFERFCARARGVARRLRAVHGAEGGLSRPDVERVAVRTSPSGARRPWRRRARRCASASPSTSSRSSSSSSSGRGCATTRTARASASSATSRSTWPSTARTCGRTRATSRSIPRRVRRG